MEETKPLFECIWAFSGKIDNAVRRCTDIAKSEAAMGYHQSAEDYLELVDELKVVKAWQHELLQEQIRVF